jgi:hypothetical protein
MQAVLVPSGDRARTDRYKATITDTSGRLVFTRIPPGDYRLFAWEDIEPFSFMDSEILREYESEGKAIHVDDGAKALVEVKLIAKR